MKNDDHISRLWYGAILGATVAVVIASLSSSRPESYERFDESWLASLRAQGW
jgi:hypothetical protein